MTNRRTHSTLISLAAVGLTTASAAAQSFNIDAGAPGLEPASTYAAAGAQPGVWNNFPSTFVAVPLVDLSGAATGVSITGASAAELSFDNTGTAGDDELLLDDFHDGPSTLTVSGLAPGNYTVYTYAWAPDDNSYVTEVAVANSPDAPQNCGGMWPGSHQQGVTYSVHAFTIDAANPDLDITFAVIVSFASLDGLQIVDSGGGGGIGTSYCTPGVANTTGVPGEIIATGVRLVSSNNVTLVASNLPNNAFGFFLTGQIQGLVMGPGGSQGNLCLSGAIGRYVGPGQIQNTGTTGSISLMIDLTQTPQPTGFVSIAAGSTWNFQAWHRDAAVGGGATSNFTDGVEVMFL